MTDIIKQLQDKDGNNVLPITHVNAVVNSEGDTLPEILDRDYPTTSKTPVENSSEVSLVTRGEKYEWNKVGNASDATGATDITSTFKYLLLNGTTGLFETALKSYVEESVRAAIGSLINNLDKGTGIKAIAGIDNSNDLGTITPANLASILSVKGGVVEDANNCNGTMLYYVTGQSLNVPSDVSFLFNIMMAEFLNWKFQFSFQTFYGDKVYYRKCKNGDWSSWREL